MRVCEGKNETEKKVDVCVCVMSLRVIYEWDVGSHWSLCLFKNSQNLSVLPASQQCVCLERPSLFLHPTSNLKHYIQTNIRSCDC